MPDPAVERVGVILVHGIGEQRRFQHLDWQLRDLIRALDGLEKQHLVTQVSVDISSSGAAAFHAEQDSWTAGPRASVDIVVRHCVHDMLRETRLLVHEVWWADVNEAYSLAKQFRFWLRGSLYGRIRVSSRARCRLPIVSGRFRSNERHHCGNVHGSFSSVPFLCWSVTQLELSPSSPIGCSIGRRRDFCASSPTTSRRSNSTPSVAALALDSYGTVKSSSFLSVSRPASRYAGALSALSPMSQLTNTTAGKSRPTVRAR